MKLVKLKPDLSILERIAKSVGCADYATFFLETDESMEPTVFAYRDYIEVEIERGAFDYRT